MKKVILMIALQVVTWSLSAQTVDWVETMGGTIRDQGQALATDSDGNIFNVGIFRNTVDFGGTVLTADSTSIYAQKCAPNGTVLWVKEICPAGSSISRQGVTVDAFGDVIIVGRFNGTVDFNPAGPGGILTATITPDYDFNTFILKLDSDGNFIWVKNVAGNTGDDVEVDTDGNIYVLGKFEGVVDFDPALGSTYNLSYLNGWESPFILKLTDDGDFLWAVKSDSLGGQITADIAVNSAGHVFSTGVFRGIVDFDPSDAGVSTLSGVAIALTAYHDSFIQELDENGNFVDVKHIPADFSGSEITAWSWTSAITIDAADNYYIAGKFEGLVDFNFTNAPGTELFDAGPVANTFVQSYNDLGVLNWTREIETLETTIRFENSIASIGNLISITGLFSNTVDFDPDPAGVFNIPAPMGEATNAFVLTLNTAGDFVWARNFTFNTFIKDVIGDEDGNIYTTGIFHLTPDFDPMGGGLIASSVGSGDIFIQKFLSSVDPPVVTVATPDMTVCCSDGIVSLGTEWIPTGNIYYTFDHFTPTYGIPDMRENGPGGEFIDLPACVTYQTFPAPFDSLGYYFLDPCECGPGVYPIIYAYTDTLTGLSDQDTMFITVEDPPAVEFDDLTINLCNYTAAVLLSPTVDEGVTCEITGDWVLAGNLFDAAGAGVGTHEIEITCTSLAGCSTTITGTVIVTNEELWHNTTSDAEIPINSGVGDEGRDIYTDENGYVFATGLYYQKTSFKDLSGNEIVIPGTLKGERFYMVCYNECGILEWVMYDDVNVANHYSKGFGIGKSADEVFVGLTYSPQAHFKTVYPDGTIIDNPFIINGSFTYGNIGILAIEGPESATFGQINAANDRLEGYIGQSLFTDLHNVGEIKDVYICGSSDLNEDYIPSVAYAKLSYDLGATSLANEWERSSVNQRLNHVANDLTGKINGEEILLAGTFSKELSLLSAPATSVTVSTAGRTDAFYTVVSTENGYLTGDYGIRTFEVDTDEMAEATSVSGDGRHFYVGGNYLAKSGTVFQAELSASSYDQSGFINGYIFSFELETSDAKIESIWNEESDIELTGLDDNAIELIFYGNYQLGTPVTSVGGIEVYNYDEMGQRNLFMGQIDMMGSDWHLPLLRNSTINNRAGNHISTRTSIGRKGDAFYTGLYNGGMSYLLGTPASGNLVATGSEIAVFNAFYLRHSTVTNELRTPIIVDEQAAIESEIATITVYPNPTSGQIRINLEDYDSDEVVDVKLYNEVGAVIYMGQHNTANFELDLSRFENGIYMLQTTFNSTSTITRIVKM